MKTLMGLAGLTMAGFMLLSCNTEVKEANYQIIPLPQEISVMDQAAPFILSNGTKIMYPEGNEKMQKNAEFLASYIKDLTGKSLAVQAGTDGKGIILQLGGNAENPEGYQLKVTSDQVVISGPTEAGVFYGIQTLRKSIPVAQGVDIALPAVEINDYPRFSYRGAMLDVSRHFFPVDSVKRFIDMLALHNINRFHWHLSEDQGWRIEIKSRPELTEIGSKRAETVIGHNSGKYDGKPYGGFFTQEEAKEIVAYAADRQIEVIPEIDVPAHSNAALAAYPQFACPVVKDFIGVLPGLGGRNSEIIYCAGNDSVFTFLQDVFDEILELFPSRYIHVGGDEARKTNWEKCPLCQKRMKKQRLANEEDLQGYFMKRISDYLRKKGREVIGWDELTNSSFLPEESIILGWQGMGTAALKAAEKGHRFIMTPARVLYLIRYQGPQWFEPVTYFGNNTLKDVFDYEPVQKDWKPEYESLLMGVQACMWTEFCNKPEDVDYLLFPRLAALAEVAWTPAGTKDWSGFLKRMDAYNAHIAEKGIVYARSMYNIQQTVTSVDGHLEVNLECIRPDVEIHYTLNGSNPAMSSHRYDGPIRVTKTQMVKAATFMNGKQMGETLDLQLTWNKATAKPLLGNKKNEMLLVNGLRGSLKYTDFEWCNWNQNDSISFTIDLQGREILNKFAIGCITNYGMGAHKPKMIRVEVSDDNRTYHTMGELNFSPEEIYLEGTFRNDYSIDMGGVSARYVRVTAEGAGICPDEHVRPGQEARVYFDEVIIE